MKRLNHVVSDLNCAQPIILASYCQTSYISVQDTVCSGVLQE